MWRKNIQGTSLVTLHLITKRRVYINYSWSIKLNFNLSIWLQVDVSNGKVLYWMEENVYCAEAQFVPRPKHFPSEVLREDDGVLISSMIKGTFLIQKYIQMIPVHFKYIFISRKNLMNCNTRWSWSTFCRGGCTKCNNNERNRKGWIWLGWTCC